MSQKRQSRQSSEEVMAAREAMENALPENVTPMSFPDPEWDDAPAPEESIPAPTDEDIQNFLNADEGEAVAEQGPDPEPEALAIQVECPCCGAQIIADCPEDAIQLCKCLGAKTLRQESEMNDEVDKAFGPDSREKYGISHTPEELVILKLIGAYVAKRKVKNVTVKLNGGDDAIFMIKKDATVVKHRRTIKSEAEV